MAALSFNEYLPWHQQQFGDELNSKDIALRYQANVTLLKSTIESHPFMAALTKRLSALSIEGVFQNMPKVPEVNFSLKPYASVMNKLYRINCLWNRDWPQPPKRGWTDYALAYTAIDDLVRTTLVCRYLDGPEIVANEIKEAAIETGLKAQASPKATDSGYYGWHAYITIPQNLLIGDIAVETNAITEFQITTQLQAALRELTHRFYEQSRASPAVGRNMSRWDFRSDRFRAEYLGHTLHLVDAMILELRDAQESPAQGGDQAPNPEEAS